jgi:hypothetical protein
LVKVYLFPKGVYTVYCTVPIFAIDYLNSRISIENGKAFVNPLICLFISYSGYFNVFVFYLIFANGFYIGFKFFFLKNEFFILRRVFSAGEILHHGVLGSLFGGKLNRFLSVFTRKKRDYM